MKSATSRALRKFDELTLDTEDLSFGHRLLVGAGYVCVAALVIATLAVDVFDQPGVEFGNAGMTHQVSTFLVVLFTGAFVAGWAFLLTGATDSRRPLFLPILALCFLQLVSANLIVAPAILLVGAALLRLAMPRGRDRWRRYQVHEFVGWIAILGLAVGAAHVETDGTGVALLGFVAAGHWLVLAMPYWVWLGFEAGRAAVGVGRHGARLAARSVIGRRYLVLAAVLTLVWPVGVSLVRVVLEGIDESLQWFVLSGLVPTLLIYWCLWKLARGGWNPSLASLAIAVNVSYFLLAYAAGSAADNSGLLEWLVSRLGLLPPTFFFVLLVAYNVFAEGTRHAERGGVHLPRSGRLPIYFGALLLIVASSAFRLGVSSSQTAGLGTTAGAAELFNELVDPSMLGYGFLAGVFFLGVPYYITSLWRKRERFVDPADLHLQDPSVTLSLGLGPGLARPTSANVVRALWITFVSPFIWLPAVVLTFVLGLTIVGLPIALKVIDALPRLIALDPGAIPPPPPVGRDPSMAQPSLAARCFWFLSFGWILGMIWIEFAWILAMPVVTLPASLRMIRRIPSVMTLSRV